MPTMNVAMRRISIVSTRPFEAVVQSIAVSMRALHVTEVARFEAGARFCKEHGDRRPRTLRLLVGNPAILDEVTSLVPDAAAYVPVTILIDERNDGVHVSYDLIASLLVPYGSSAALAIARDLDAKIEILLNVAKARDDEEKDKPADPIAESGSLAAADALLMGGLLNDW